MGCVSPEPRFPQRMRTPRGLAVTEDTGSRCSCRPTLLSDTSPRRLGSPGLAPARGTWLHPSAEPAPTRRQQLLPRRRQHTSSRPREPGPAVRAQLILKRTGRGGDRHPAPGLRSGDTAKAPVGLSRPMDWVVGLDHRFLTCTHQGRQLNTNFPTGSHLTYWVYATFHFCS